MIIILLSPTGAWAWAELGKKKVTYKTFNMEGYTDSLMPSSVPIG